MTLGAARRPFTYNSALPASFRESNRTACVYTRAKAPSHAENPRYSCRQRFAFGSSIRRRCSRRSRNSVGNTVYFRSVGGGSILSLLTPRADTSLTRSFRRRARPKCRALAGFLAFPSSRARSSRTCAAALTCSSGRTSSAPTRVSRPRRIFLIPRPTASSAFATWLGTTPSTGLRNSPGAILNATGSRRRPTPPSTRISRRSRVPELSTWAMMMLGFVGTVLVAKRRRSFRFA